MNYSIQLTKISERSESLLAQLFSLWKKSVKTTHSFLSDDEIDAIAHYVPSALKDVPILLVTFGDNSTPVAFMGLNEDNIEMLFVSHSKLRKGIGKCLVHSALHQYGCTKVCVNEQNPEATAFYKHMGFSTVKRSDIDEQGNPYPILYMQYMEQSNV